MLFKFGLRNWFKAGTKREAVKLSFLQKQYRNFVCNPGKQAELAIFSEVLMKLHTSAH
jgi:hypothetical protein